MTGPVERLSRLLSDLPARLAEAREKAIELAAREFTAESEDGHVVATVDGAGQVVALRFPADLARRVDNLTLSGRIAEAVNRALDLAETARDDLLAAAVPVDDLAGAEELFAHRIAELQRTLDSIESRLRDLTR